ncbi:isocitrate lyase/phosphoenolpyruvate mutase family protein, partial [Streptomyces shenzhenensis]|uniref:isocitrate lyase/phosphoenolpyruvate mutase family protein n=1 Tax=Streptomyces shenzhenensis TaxID=943815 RepID=UPI0033FEFC39
MSDIAQQAVPEAVRSFGELHRRPGPPLVLPTAWDHASAAALAARGFAAIGTAGRRPAPALGAHGERGRR